MRTPISPIIMVSLFSISILNCIYQIDDCLNQEEEKSGYHKKFYRPDMQFCRTVDGLVCLIRRNSILEHGKKQQPNCEYRYDVSNNNGDLFDFRRQCIENELESDMLPMLLATCQTKIDDNHHHKN